MRYTIKKNKTTSLSKRKILKNKSFVPTLKKSYHKKWKDRKLLNPRFSKKKKKRRKKDRQSKKLKKEIGGALKTLQQG